LDLGWEQKLTNSHKKSWVPWQSWGMSLRYAINNKHGLAARYDRTRDPNNIIPELKSITGPMPHGWNSNGYTLTYEYLFNIETTFRVEGRYVKSQDAVFKTNIPGHYIDEDSFLMTSMAMSF
jgi:Putative beta-barrel porin-2, OmpL-like. bbp2